MMPSYDELSAAIMTVVETAVPKGRVYNRRIVATNEVDYNKWYANDDGIGNVWFVRRIQLHINTTSMDDPAEEIHVFELLYLRALEDIETEDELHKSSHTLFQNQIEDVRHAFATNKNIGLDKGTTHGGLEIPSSIPSSARVGDAQFHAATCVLTVSVQDC